MISFPNAKINIGLHITGKREDGFHSIETIFYPVKWCDIVEFVPVENTGKGNIELGSTGISIPGDLSVNTCMKAYKLLAQDYDLPAVKSHLHKIIPIGAGLGGGSADGAFMLTSLNQYFQLGLTPDRLKEYALQLGSDCPFFIDNVPCHATGRGEILSPIDLSLEEYLLLVVVPPIHVSTAEAFRVIQPAAGTFDLKHACKLPVSQWKNKIHNQFEDNIFAKCPGIKEIKDKLYEYGAVYASMSGSGSAVFGIFPGTFQKKVDFPDCTIWEGYL